MPDDPNPYRAPVAPLSRHDRGPPPFDWQAGCAWAVVYLSAAFTGGLGLSCACLYLLINDPEPGSPGVALVILGISFVVGGFGGLLLLAIGHLLYRLNRRV